MLFQGFASYIAFVAESRWKQRRLFTSGLMGTLHKTFDSGVMNQTRLEEKVSRPTEGNFVSPFILTIRGTLRGSVQMIKKLLN